MITALIGSTFFINHNGVTWTRKSYECPTCEGCGYESDEDCSMCDGLGVIDEDPKDWE